MKKYINKSLLYVLFGSSFFTLNTACDDFLDQEPLSQVSPERYLLQDTQLEAYVNNYYDESFPNMGSYKHDDATDNAQGTHDRFLKDTWTVPQSGGSWSFNRIYALNYFLQTVVPRLENNELKGSEINNKQYIGEGYFLRALEYFRLLQDLGDFPIVTETLDPEMSVLIEASKRKPRNEVARFILSDLDKAIELMTDNPQKTRITRKAALLLKSRVALFEATWEKYHAGTALVPGTQDWPGAKKDYNANFKFPSGSAENEINFFLDEAIKAAEQVADNTPLTPNNQIIRDDKSKEKNPYYDMFACHDPSTYSEVILCRTYSTALNVNHNYNHTLYSGGNTGFTNQMEKAFLMQNGLPWYANGSGYAGDNFIEDTKIDRDWRWRLFMKAPGEVKAVDNITVPERFPEVPRLYIVDSKNSTSTGYIFGKGYSLDYNDQILSKDETAFVVYRASEAYLNYIEASYLRYGNINEKAEKYWKELRKRAGVDEDFYKTIANTDVAKEALTDWGAYSHGQLIDATLYNIRRERRCELINEGLRYKDLLRWRAMDQLNGYQLEGAKIFGPMKDIFVDENGNSLLVYDQQDDSKNNVSSPSFSDYLRPNQLTKTNQFYNGFYFYEAHYLQPIAVQHFLITSADGQDVETSPIYQNPGWPIVAGAVCE